MSKFTALQHCHHNNLQYYLEDEGGNYMGTLYLAVSTTEEDRRNFRRLMKRKGFKVKRRRNPRAERERKLKKVLDTH